MTYQATLDESPGKTVVARWQDWSGMDRQHLVLSVRSNGIVADGVVLGTADQRHFAAAYRVECDATWRVRMTQVRVVGVDRTIDLTSDGEGHWRDRPGALVPRLDGAIDLDLSATPFTNTLPIRRLDLAEGEAADIRVAYVRLPDLTVTMDPQRYTCLRRGRQYRYESLDSDFVRDIEIDAHGLVVTYPGLFRRVL
jgi:hypothetical protein